MISHALVLDVSALARTITAAWLADALGVPSCPLWCEDIDLAHDADPARRSLSAEMLRAPTPTGAGVRAVLRRCGDVTLLVVVARRSVITSAAFDDLARIVGDGSERVSVPAPSHENLVTRTVALPAGTPVNAILAAAAAHEARYAGRDDSTVAVCAGAASTGDFVHTRSVRVPPDRPVAELLTEIDEWFTRPAPSGGDMPGVGVVVERGVGGVRQVVIDPPWPVTLAVVIGEDGSVGATLYIRAGDRFAAMATEYSRRIGELASAFGARTTRASTLAEAEQLPVDELHRVRALGSGPELSQPRRTDSIDERVRHQAFQHPDAPAVSDETNILTYAELSDRAARLARVLRARGAGPGDRVGVCLDRDAHLVVGLLAVLMTGACYVPMDWRHPARRVRAIADDAAVRLILSDRDDVSWPRDVPVLDTETASAASSAEPAAEAAPAGEFPPPHERDAYVIYTSGSTGTPKGVPIRHDNVLALLDATRTDMSLDSSDTWTMFHSPAFDFSVWEIWAALTTGGHLVVVPFWITRSPRDFRELLIDRGVTVLSQTPSALSGLAELDWRSGASRVRLVVLGGEPVDSCAVRLWFHMHPPAGCRVVNMFGITETTVHVTAKEMTVDDVSTGSRSVGRPLPGWSVSVRDPHGRPLPIGVTGEICVGGRGLARGYLNRPELSARRFVPDEFAPGSPTLYRSGDRGRMLADGAIEHLGRLDEQVTISGHRIELAEIRAVLRACEGVRDADVRLTTDGDPGLDAWVVLTPDVQARDVRSALARALPDYMLPRSVTVLTELPRNDNGKLDPSRLPAPELADSADSADDAAAAGSDQCRPPPPTSQWLRGLWQELLGVSPGAGDNFFMLGGTSLSAAKLAESLRKSGAAGLSLRDIYLNPTISELSEYLERLEKTANE